MQRRVRRTIRRMLWLKQNIVWKSSIRLDLKANLNKEPRMISNLPSFLRIFDLLFSTWSALLSNLQMIRSCTLFIFSKKKIYPAQIIKTIPTPPSNSFTSPWLHFIFFIALNLSYILAYLFIRGQKP